MNKSLMLAVIATMALAGTAHAQGITVDQAWARATSPSQTVGGVFLTITDKGTPDTLVSASSPIADMLELHETVADNGVMKMRPIAGLPVAAGQSVVLKPGSYHLTSASDSAGQDKAVVAVGPEVITADAVARVSLGFLGGGAGVLAAVILFIVTLVRRSSAKSRLRAARPPAIPG